MKMLTKLNRVSVENWFYKLVATDPRNLGALILRVTLGALMFAHGAQKLFGWFGGYGFNSTMDYLTTSVNLPWIIAFLVILIESIGGLCLILGAGTRLMAAGIAAVMIGAIIMVHGANGLFMDWNNTMMGEGFEYHLLAIAMAAALMVSGGGMWSLDSFLNKRGNSNNSLYVNEDGLLRGVHVKARRIAISVSK